MTGSQSHESFTRGQTSASPSNTRGKSRMHKGARTDLCGGREATHVPTATISPLATASTTREQQSERPELTADRSTARQQQIRFV